MVGCGEIGGNLEADGALVVGLVEAGNSGLSGIAYFAPTPAGISISLFMTSTNGEFGNSTAALAQQETNAAGPSSTTTVEAEVATYPLLAEVRELAIRPGSMLGDNLIFLGTIQTIRVAPPGNV